MPTDRGNPFTARPSQRSAGHLKACSGILAITTVPTAVRLRRSRSRLARDGRLLVRLHRKKPQPYERTMVTCNELHSLEYAEKAPAAWVFLRIGSCHVESGVKCDRLASERHQQPGQCRQ